MGCVVCMVIYPPVWACVTDDVSFSEQVAMAVVILILKRHKLRLP